MSTRPGQLAFSPEEVQHPKRGISKLVANEGDPKPTYVIIIKQEEKEQSVESSVPDLDQSDCRQSLDSIRKNLTNIEDDEYDSGISSANLFLKDDEAEDVEEAEGLVLPSAKRTRIHEDPPPSIPFSTGEDVFGGKCVVKRNLFFNDLSPITPPAGSVCANKILMTNNHASPDLFPAAAAGTSGSVNTPTTNQDFKTHPAVRKIILVSPNQCQSTPNVTTPSCTTAMKSLYSESPLASSTPITSGSSFIVSTTSPDSGISLSVSSLSASTILTPSAQNLSVRSQTTPTLVPTSIKTTQAGPGQPIESKITFTKQHVTRIETREPEPIDEGIGDKSLDTSLANIQWLGGFQLGEKPPTLKSDPPTVATRWTSEERGRRKEYSHEEITRVNRECGRTKRPPYSYMVLIQMALQSRIDQKMTLREICKWIEDTFSFYKYTAKPGWKNSIRHNLSYYQCFIRTSEDKKKHGARWTLKFDDESREEHKKDNLMNGPLTNMIPVIVNQTPGAGGVFNPSLIPVSAATTLPPNVQLPFTLDTRRKRTGPMPILPRPSPVPQAYALVPLHSLPPHQQQQQQPSPFIFHLPPSATESVPQAPVPIKCASTTQHERPIAPSTIFTNIRESASSSGNVNILRQAWLNADISEDETATSLSSILKEQGISIGSARKEKKCLSKQTKVSATQGLPKPKMYESKSKKRTRSRVKKLPKVPEEKELLESSESETDDQFEKGLPTPLRQLFQSPDEKSNKSEHLTTSTPVRNTTVTPEHLPSPIRGWTPLRSTGALDGSFLDILQEEAMHALKLFSSPQDSDGKKGGPSPNTSLTEFGIFQISPDKTNKNLSDCQLQGLSRIFSDFDPNFMTDGDGLPIDIVNFNLSGFQQPSPKNGDEKT